MLITTIVAINVLSMSLTASPFTAVSDTLPVLGETISGFGQQRNYNDNQNDLPLIPKREQAVKTFRVTATAYSSTREQTDSTPFVTADGSAVADGIIAANFLPFGSRVRFPELSGDKVFEVHDRMHPRFSSRVDIWMVDRVTAIEFGIKRNVLVEVLPKETELAVSR